MKLICQILVFSCSCWILHCSTFKIFHRWRDSMNFYLGKSTFYKWWSIYKFPSLFEGSSTWFIYCIDSYLKGRNCIVSKGSGKPLYEFRTCWKMSGNSGGKFQWLEQKFRLQWKQEFHCWSLNPACPRPKAELPHPSLFSLLVLEPDLLMVIAVKSCCSI